MIRLDKMPNSWEDRTVLFCGFLIQQGSQSQTVKSYVSAIKNVLRQDDYPWCDEKILLSSLTCACKLENDRLKCRFPIQKGLFELLIFELKRILPEQVYLQTTYRALFCLAYYGLMRIGELTHTISGHAVKACNIHIGKNKDKILIVLYSSKTHGENCFPQKIKITSACDSDKTEEMNLICPFTAVRKYLHARGGYTDDSENFFIFRDRSVILPSHVRTVLKNCLQALNLDADLYNTHSFRIGRTVDLWKKNKNLEELKRIGRWSSNAVYRYLKL